VRVLRLSMQVSFESANFPGHFLRHSVSSRCARCSRLTVCVSWVPVLHALRAAARFVSHALRVTRGPHSIYTVLLTLCLVSTYCLFRTHRSLS
jgi:hypothetical protein